MANSSLTSEEIFWGWTLDERGRLGSSLLAGPCGMAVSGDPGGDTLPRAYNWYKWVMDMG